MTRCPSLARLCQYLDRHRGGVPRNRTARRDLHPCTEELDRLTASDGTSLSLPPVPLGGASPSKRQRVLPMRCPNCKKALPFGVSKPDASIRCVFCGTSFRVSKEPEQPVPGNPPSPLAKSIPAHAQVASRPRFINDRYALAPNPREGGMALVYRGSDMLDANRQVAVKVFRHDKIEQPILEEVFKRETQALKELDHGGIVKLFHWGWTRIRASISSSSSGWRPTWPNGSRPRLPMGGTTLPRPSPSRFLRPLRSPTPGTLSTGI